MLLLAFLGTALPLTAGAQDPPQSSSPSRNDPTTQRLQRLKEQSERNLGNKRLLYDYVDALGEAGRDADMLELIPRIDLSSAPVSVLVRAGRAASNQKRFAQAVEIYRAALQRAPDRLDVITGLAYALTDDGKPDEATTLLESRHKLMWKEVPLLEAYAEALRARREHAQALLVYDRILALSPGNREALRNRIFTVARLGAPHRALELAQKSAGVLNEDELLSLKSDRAAITARWGAAADENAPDRFANADAALAQNEQLLQELQAAGKTGSAAERRLQFDRIELLRNRVRMHEAIELYEKLLAGGVEVPAYAQIAAADAYLYLEQPEKARDLYLHALPLTGENFAAQLQLFYAYSDAEQHRQALAHIDKLVAGTSPQIGAYSPLTVGDNPDYASALATAAAARGYQDYLCEAQERLEAFRDLAPYNLGAREKLAGVYAARGWPRRAEQEYQWVLAAEPRDREARVGYANSLREQRDWVPAEREAKALEAEFPEDKQVQRVARLWRIHEMWELQVDAGTGTSSGSASPLGSREHAFETHLYSPPIKGDWRAFLHQFEAQAVFPDGNGYWRRIGVGAEYRARDLRLTAEVNEGYDDASDVGVSVLGDWWADDHWNFEAAADSSSNDIPLQGRIAGVHGNSLRAGVTYRVSESRSFGAAYQTLDFSDGNRRNILSGSASQRFITGPVYKLDGVLGVYTSNNSAANTDYFNPDEDFSIGFTAIGEQRVWRRYSRSFLHRLSLSVGRYEQRGFGSDRTAGIRYEHQWDLDDRFSLLYGAQRTMHPYDGQREFANFYNLSLNWKF